MKTSVSKNNTNVLKWWCSKLCLHIYEWYKYFLEHWLFPVTPELSSKVIKNLYHTFCPSKRTQKADHVNMYWSSPLRFLKNWQNLYLASFNITRVQFLVEIIRDENREQMQVRLKFLSLNQTLDFVLSEKCSNVWSIDLQSKLLFHKGANSVLHLRSFCAASWNVISRVIGRSSTASITIFANSFESFFIVMSPLVELLPSNSRGRPFSPSLKNNRKRGEIYISRVLLTYFVSDWPTNELRDILAASHILSVFKRTRWSVARIISSFF